MNRMVVCAASAAFVFSGPTLARAQIQDELKGFGFGPALAVTVDFPGKARVESAEIIAGVVRITDENDSSARLMLETHYFFRPPFRAQQLGVEAKDWGVGPFVAVQSDDNDLLGAVAVGLMAGVRQPGSDRRSFNFGVGVLVDPNSRVLGDGVLANMPLPAGETVVRFKEEAQYSVILITSFSF